MLKMEGIQSLKGSWPWPWPSIRPYGIPSCITHRLPIYQISFKLKKLFVDGRTYGRTAIFPLYTIRSTFGSRPKNLFHSLRLFGHIARGSPREDHHRALAAAIWQVPSDRKRPIGGPSHTWLHAIEAEFGRLNFGLATAWRKATTRDEWGHIVDWAQQCSSGVRYERRWSWEILSLQFVCLSDSLSVC